MRWAVSDTAMLVPGERWGAPTESGDSVRVRDESALSPRQGRSSLPSRYVRRSREHSSLLMSATF